MQRSPLAWFLHLATALLGLVSGSALAQTTLALKLTESAMLPSVGKVTFVHAHDDRCPAPLQCLLPGDAYALLWLEFETKKSLVAVSWPRSRKDLGASNRFMGNEFCFVSLEPQPSKITPPQALERVLTVNIRKNPSSKSACADGV